MIGGHEFRIVGFVTHRTECGECSTDSETTLSDRLLEECVQIWHAFENMASPLTPIGFIASAEGWEDGGLLSERSIGTVVFQNDSSGKLGGLISERTSRIRIFP